MSPTPPAAPSAKRKRSGRLRRWIARLLLLLVSLGSGLGLLEWYLRSVTRDHFGPAVDYRYLYLDEDGWTPPAPNFRGEMGLGGRRTTIELDGSGLRCGPTAPRRDSELRVLCVGDSMVFGVGANADETFASRLQGRLGKTLAPRPLTVSIAAAPSFNVYDYAKLIARHRETFAPDAIVVGVFLGNDFYDNFEVARTLVNGFMLQGQMAMMAEHSVRVRLALQYRTLFYFENFLREQGSRFALEVPNVTADVEAHKDFPPNHATGLFLDALEEDQARANIMTRMLEALAQVRTAAKGIPLVVALLPAPEHVSRERFATKLEALGLAADQHEFGLARRRLIERATAAGFQVVDVAETFGTHGDLDQLFITGDFHYAPAGHTAVAAILEPAVRQALSGR